MKRDLTTPHGEIDLHLRLALTINYWVLGKVQQISDFQLNCCTIWIRKYFLDWIRS